MTLRGQKSIINIISLMSVYDNILLMKPYHDNHKNIKN